MTTSPESSSDLGNQIAINPDKVGLVAECPHGVRVAFHGITDTPHSVESAIGWLERGMRVTVETENVWAQRCLACRP